jgi:hypothetical protein
MKLCVAFDVIVDLPDINGKSAIVGALNGSCPVPGIVRNSYVALLGKMIFSRVTSFQIGRTGSG